VVGEVAGVDQFAPPSRRHRGSPLHRAHARAERTADRVAMVDRMKAAIGPAASIRFLTPPPRCEAAGAQPIAGPAQTDPVTTVRAHVPEFTRPGFRWRVTQVDEHLCVAIQHDAVRAGRLRCWVDGWSASVCLHDRDDTVEDVVQVQGEFDAAVAILFETWASAAADVEISQAAHELAALDVDQLRADVLEVPHPVRTACRHRAGRARAREVGLVLATAAVTAPPGVHLVGVAVGERCAGPYARALNALSFTATGLALRRRR